jgi:surfeit locus 1 family protein
VANRTQGGVAGEHIVALFELDGGQLVLVNRGFAPVNTTVEVGAAPGGPVTLTGWLRESVERGWLGAVDNGESDRVPRLDVEAIEGRLEELVTPLWVQLASDGSVSRPDAFPAPVPLPELDPGPHLGYMGQWFIFSLLGAGFYVALLRRWSLHGGKPVEVPA